MSLELTANDRYEIKQQLYKFAWMCDEKEWHLMDDLMAPDATLDYTGTGAVTGSYKETLDWLSRAFTDWPINFHAITNVTFEVDGDEVHVRSLFIAPLGRQEDKDQWIITYYGYYFDTFVKVDGQWKIRARRVQQVAKNGSFPEGYETPK